MSDKKVMMNRPDGLPASVPKWRVKEMEAEGFTLVKKANSKKKKKGAK